MAYNTKSSLIKPTKSLGEIKNELLISVKSGIISSGTAQQIMLKAEREFYLSMHKYAITCSTTGYWMTYLPSETSKNGRTKKRSRTKEGIENSYNSRDTINMVRWKNIDKYQDTIKAVKDFITIRKTYDCFNLDNNLAWFHHILGKLFCKRRRPHHRGKHKL